MFSCEYLLDNRAKKAKEFISEQIEKDSKVIQVLDFVKLDGQEISILGVKAYELEFDLTIEYTDEAIIYFNDMFPAFSDFKTYKKDEKYNSWMRVKSFLMVKGQKVKLKGDVYFVEKDSGWQPKSFKIKSYEAIK